MYNLCMVRYNFLITEKQLEALRNLAQNGLSVSEHIRRAIDEYLERSQNVAKSPSR